MRSKISKRPRAPSHSQHASKGHQRVKGSRKERYFECLGTKWGPVTLRGWLEIFAVVVAALVAYSILFVRRQIIEYRPEHTFAVRALEFFSAAHAAADPVGIEGNKVTVLHNGVGIFPVMLEAIRSAMAIWFFVQAMWRKRCQWHAMP